MKKKDVVYRHYRIRELDEDGNPVEREGHPVYREDMGSLTVAVRFDGDDLRVGASFCSPLEKGFNRERGRQVAGGRAKCARSDIQGRAVVPKVEGQPLRDQIGAALSAMEGPQWFPKFVKELTSQWEEISSTS